MSSSVEMKIVVSNGDPDDLIGRDRAVQQLLAELRRLDVHAVIMPAAATASGARGIDPAEVGALLVSLVPTPELLGHVIDVVRSWIAARARRSVKVEIAGDIIEVTGATESDVKRLIDVFEAKHGVPRLGNS